MLAGKNNSLAVVTEEYYGQAITSYKIGRNGPNHTHIFQKIQVYQKWSQFYDVFVYILLFCQSIPYNGPWLYFVSIFYHLTKWRYSYTAFFSDTSVI